MQIFLDLLPCGAALSVVDEHPEPHGYHKHAVLGKMCYYWQENCPRFDRHEQTTVCAFSWISSLNFLLLQMEQGKLRLMCNHTKNSGIRVLLEKNLGEIPMTSLDVAAPCGVSGDDVG